MYASVNADQYFQTADLETFSRQLIWPPSKLSSSTRLRSPPILQRRHIYSVDILFAISVFGHLRKPGSLCYATVLLAVRLRQQWNLAIKLHKLTSPVATASAVETVQNSRPIRILNIAYNTQNKVTSHTRRPTSLLVGYSLADITRDVFQTDVGGVVKIKMCE